MTQPKPTFGARIGDRASLASALGVHGSDIASSAPQVVSCGVPFLFVQLASRAAVDAVDVNRATYRACLTGAGIDDMPVFLFTLDRDGAAGEETVYSRMLAPGFGIVEDPATGGASGPLGCYLAANELLPDATLRHFVSLQGAAMKRPSRLHVSIERSGTSITRVRVGGRSVLVGGGELIVP
jgi:trans-2,3-dihydro-3-hydroxyanthranilate isomerase